MLDALPYSPVLHQVPQRTHDRRKVRLRALTQTDITTPERLGIVTDLSAGGAFIEMHARPPRGSRLWVSMTLRDGHSLYSYAEVVRVTERGVGARFVRLDPDAAEHLGAVSAPA